MVKKILLILAFGLFALVALTYTQRGPRPLVATAGQDVGGKIAFARAGAIWLYEGGKDRQLTTGPKDRSDKRDAFPSISPDGTEIVYTRFDEGFSDLYKMSLDDPTTPEALTNNRPNAETGGEGYVAQALWALTPAWSPNGERIAYTSDVRTEYPGLFSMDANGEGIRKLEFLDHSTQTVERPSWSPDGTKIAVANYLTKGAKGQIWVLDTATGKWIELTDAKDGAYDPAWSPDGEWLAFTMREGTSHNIYVVPTDAQKWTEQHPAPVRLTTDGASRSPVWSPDGSRLAFLSYKEGSFDLRSAEVKIDDNGELSLASTETLLEKARIDADSGLSWSE